MRLPLECKVVVVSSLVLLAACGLGASPGDGAGTAGTSGAGPGSGAGSTGSTGGCTAASECAAFSCKCADGTAWGTARYCLNRVCQGQASTCQDACRGNGGMAGSGGATTGSGAPGSTCSVAADCGAYPCDCADGTAWDVQYCGNRVCQDAQATCQYGCRNNGGVR